MTINEFIKILKSHKVDFEKDLCVAMGEDDGEDFHIEEGHLSVFLVGTEWGEKIEHHFLDNERK